MDQGDGQVLFGRRVFRVTQGVHALIRPGPNGIQYQLRLVEVAGDRAAIHGIGEERKNRKPDEASPLGRTSDKGMVDEFHQPLASGFVGRPDENRPDRMDPEGLFVPLLLLMNWW
jgi:hypothetical protein